MGFSPQQAAALQDRLANARKRRPAPAVAATVSAQRRTDAVILGIDPSLRGTGFAVLSVTTSAPRAVAHGTIHCPAGWEQSRCLALIARTLRDVVAQHRPTVCAVEGLFFAQNLQTALIMGQARGAALAVVAEAGLEIYELAPRKVKQSIVGYGAAQKLAVAKMVQRRLQLAELPAPDAADALAVALAYAQTQQGFSLTPPKRV